MELLNDMALFVEVACWCRCNLDQLNRKVPIQY